MDLRMAAVLLAVAVQTSMANSLSGVHLKAIAAELVSVYYIKRDLNGTMTGYGGATYHLLHWLSESLNFTYEIETLPVYDKGRKLPNGSYTGIFGYIQREESDVALGAFGAVTLEPFLEMSYPWTVYEGTILIPYPTEKSKLWAVFLPFQLNVWLGFLASSVFLASTMVLYKVITGKKKERRVYWGSQLMYLVGVATAQGGYLAHRGRSVILLATVWCLTMFIMVSAYSGLLISYLSAIRLVPIADSVHELAVKSPELLIYTFRDSGWDNVFMTAKEGDYKVLGDYLRKNPGSRMQENEQCQELSFKNKGFCVTARIAAELYAERIWKETGQCHVSRSRETFFPILVSLLFNRKSPYHRIINRRILTAASMGLTKKWFDEESKLTGKCMDRTAGARNRPLRFIDLQSAFLVLGIGAAVALVVFCLEITIKKFWRKY